MEPLIFVGIACPWCEYMNRSAAKFCGNCSRPLSFNRSCTQCDANNPAHHRFCEACGAPLLEDASQAPVGQSAVETYSERRVTEMHKVSPVPVGQPAVETASLGAEIADVRETPRAPKSPRKPRLLGLKWDTPAPSWQWSWAYLRSWAVRNRWELLAVVLLTIAAAVLRIYGLDDILPGVHQDEGDFGLEALRVLEEGWIGVYTMASHGYPTGPVYFVALMIWLLDASIYTVRLSMALIGIVTVPAAYLLFRLGFGHWVALFATSGLMWSYWHVHLSRIAFPMVSLSFVISLAATALLWAMRSGSGWSWLVAGALLGVIPYTYLSYQVFVVVVAGILVTYVFLQRDRLRHSLVSVGILAIGMLLVAAPMILFILDSPDVYFNRMRSASLFSVPEFTDAEGFRAKADFVVGRAWDALTLLLRNPRLDVSDGLGGQGAMDVGIAVLAYIGLAVSVARWRSPPYLLAALAVLGALSTVMLTEAQGIMRRSVIAIPWVFGLAGIGAVGIVSLTGRMLGKKGQIAAVGGLVVILLLGGAWNLQYYFGEMTQSSHVKWVFPTHHIDGLEAVHSFEDPGTIYFYSSGMFYENDTIRFLYPDTPGINRSREFGTFGLERLDAGPVTYVLTGSDYIGEIDRLKELHPGGETIIDAESRFIVYHLPADPSFVPDVNAVLALDDEGPVAAIEVISDDFERPRSVVVADGRIYVADPGAHELIVLEADGRQVARVRESIQPFSHPVDVDADAAGNIYVLDSDLRQVSMHDAAGDFMQVLPIPEFMARAAGFHVDSQGRIWLAITPAQLVAAYDSEGQEIVRFSTALDGMDLQPVDVAFHAADAVYVTVVGTMTSVMRFSEDGELLDSWQLTRANSAEAPHLSVDSSGVVYVTDPEQGAILRMVGGSRVWTEADMSSWILPRPPLGKAIGIALDEQTGSLVVTDSTNGNIYRLSLERFTSRLPIMAATINPEGTVLTDTVTSTNPSSAVVHQTSTSEGTVLTDTVTSTQPVQWPNISLVQRFSGLQLPVDLAHAKDGSGRLYVVEQKGQIQVFENDVKNQTPFLDIRERVECCGERGLLGIAFPPDFSSSRHVYANYTTISPGSLHTHVSRFSLRRDAHHVDPDSEEIILQIPQPSTLHQGGQIAFGPKGNLWVGMGDGGPGGDTQNKAQNGRTFLGKLLRLDVTSSTETPYTIPADNPFIGNDEFLDEIWAYGLRNPWRFSFDRQTGDLYIADVGEVDREEVNFQPANSPGGENYGWKIFEGTLCRNPSNCSIAGLTLPVAEYKNNTKDYLSVTGGFVFRGPNQPSLKGIYFYADYGTGRIWGLQQINGTWETKLLLDTSHAISSFGEDEAGNLYVVDHGGQVLQMQAVEANKDD